MNKEERNDSIVEKLIEQDTGISKSLLKESRMKLELSLKSLEKNAEWSRHQSTRAVVWLALCYLFGFGINLIAGSGIGVGQFVGVVWVVCTWVAMIATAILLVRHLTIHKPALERGRTDLQIAQFNELQQQITELNEKIGK